MEIRSLYESQQFSTQLLFQLFKRADDLQEHARQGTIPQTLNGKILAALFYEPSTRTRMSFESAMIRLGGNTISTENAAEFTSFAKGESIEDSTRVIGGYVDIIAMRTKQEGLAKNAADVSYVPVINAGDGKGQHPTQALLDVYTIYRELKQVNGIHIAMVGDLKNGRTVRSLCYLLGKFENIKITFVSPNNLRMQDDIKAYLKKHDVVYEQTNDLNEILSRADAIYITRIQKERMSGQDYESAKGQFVVGKDDLDKIKPNAILMHPLPHIEEISLPASIEETDRRVAYIRQAANGLYARMALLEWALKKGPFKE